jgi:peptide/nickel transport system substrate-binding protein
MSIQRLYGIDDVFWNTSHRPLNDVKVRQALAYATPIKDIIKAVYHGYAEPANAIVPQNKYLDPKVPFYSYNLAKAKQLIKNSSIPNGATLTMYLVSGDPDSSLLGTILQSAWAQIGVKLRLVKTDYNALVARLFGDNYQVAFFGTAKFVNDTNLPDGPGDLVYDYESGTHGLGSYMNNPTVTRLQREAAASTSESLRRQDYQKLQRMSMANAQLLPIAWVPQFFLLNKRVHNWEAVGNTAVKLRDVYLSS